MISIACPHCEAKFKTSPAYIGREATCLKCGGVILVESVGAVTVAGPTSDAVSDLAASDVDDRPAEDGFHDAETVANTESPTKVTATASPAKKSSKRRRRSRRDEWDRYEPWDERRTPGVVLLTVMVGVIGLAAFVFGRSYLNPPTLTASTVDRSDENATREGPASDEAVPMSVGQQVTIGSAVVELVSVSVGPVEMVNDLTGPFVREEPSLSAHFRIANRDETQPLVFERHHIRDDEIAMTSAAGDEVPKLDLGFSVRAANALSPSDTIAPGATVDHVEVFERSDDVEMPLVLAFDHRLFGGDGLTRFRIVAGDVVRR